MRRKTTLTAAAQLLTIVALLAMPAAASAQTTEFGGKQGPPLDVGQMYMVPASAGPVAIRAGRLFDPKSGTNLVNQVILIKSDRITDVGPASQIQIPAGARVIDLSRATVLPGLIDDHVHQFNVSEPNAALLTLHGIRNTLGNLRAGYTTTLDLGSPTYVSVTVRDAIKQGWIMGPRMQVAGVRLNPRQSGSYTPPDFWTAPFGQGPETGPGSPDARDTWQNAQNINSPWLARAAVREHRRYGTDWIKVYMTEDSIGGEYEGAFYEGTDKMINVPSLSLEELQAIVDEAHQSGLKVASHAYGGEGLRRVLQAGVDLPMHAAVGVTGAAGLDEETIRLWKQPLANGKQRPVLQTLWDLVGGMEKGDMQTTGERTTRFKLTEQSFKRLVAAGIMQVFGSGVTGGVHGVHGTQVIQFPIYVKWGMTPAEALKVGTINAAETLNYDWIEKVGTIEKGKFADIIAFAGDPLVDITETARVKFVMKGGVIFRDDMMAAPAVSSSSAAVR